MGCQFWNIPTETKFKDVCYDVQNEDFCQRYLADGGCNPKWKEGYCDKTCGLCSDGGYSFDEDKSMCVVGKYLGQTQFTSELCGEVGTFLNLSAVIENSRCRGSCWDWEDYESMCEAPVSPCSSIADCTPLEDDAGHKCQCIEKEVLKYTSNTKYYGFGDGHTCGAVYSPDPKNLTQAGAKEKCEAQGYNLIRLESKIDAIGALVIDRNEGYLDFGRFTNKDGSGTATQFWIGLVKEDGVWKWEGTEGWSPVSPDDDIWGDNEPSSAGSCAYWDIKEKKLFAIDCDETLYHVMCAA